MIYMCPEHKKEVKLNNWGKYFHFNGKDSNGKSLWCNKTKEQVEIKEALDNPLPNEDTFIRERVEETPDWDKISRGKVRFGFINTILKVQGLTRFSSEDKQILEELVELAMSGK